MSIPVFCYLEQTSSESDVLADLKWAIRPLGPPLTNAPPWTSFNMPLPTMVNQITGLSDEMRHEFMILIDSLLKAKYLAQTRFDGKAPVYSEEDLRKRATDINPPSQLVDLNPSLIRSGADSDPRNPTNSKREFRKEKPQARKSGQTALDTPSKKSTTQSDDGHGKNESAKIMKIKNESDKGVPRTTNPDLALPMKLEEDTFSSVKASPEISSLTLDMNSMLGKKRKNEEPHIGLPPPAARQDPSTPLSAPNGPKKWSYFDNYKRLPPSTANSPGVQPRPSTGHWKSKQIAPSRQTYDS
jgi:hypothetical protein